MDTDVAIVGGGIVGASVAAHVAGRSDADVVVFERKDRLAGETTAKSNAMFRMTGSAPERRLKRYGLAMYNDMLGDTQADHDVDPLYERLDRLESATTADGAAALRERAEAGPGRYLEPDDVAEQALEPALRTDALEGALWYPDAIRMEPRVLALEFAARARADGATFETGTAVRDVTVANGAVTGLETHEGAVDADYVVSAAGPNNPNIAELAGYDLPLKQTLGPILDVRPDRPLGHALANVKHPETGVYYTGRGDGTAMIGRAGGPYDRARRRDLGALDEDRVPDDIRAAMDETARDLVPALALDEVEVRDEWVGLVSKTPDGEPIIGFTDVEGFGVAAFNSEAIQLAPAAGRILAEQVLDGRPPSDYPHVSPGRFDADL